MESIGGIAFGTCIAINFLYNKKVSSPLNELQSVVIQKGMTSETKTYSHYQIIKNSNGETKYSINGKDYDDSHITVISSHGDSHKQQAKVTRPVLKKHLTTIQRRAVIKALQQYKNDNEVPSWEKRLLDWSDTITYGQNYQKDHTKVEIYQ